LFDLLSNRSAVNCELVGVTRTKVRDLRCCFHDCGTRRVLRPEKRSQRGFLRATARVTFWGTLAMALTAGIGKLFGTVV